MAQSHESSKISLSSKESLEARSELFEALKNYPGTPEEVERSLGLFVRGSLLARIFAIRELYEQIVEIPGMIFDVGTWRGQTAVVCENLRAIFEPMHMNRRIACFDTFEGYVGFSKDDKSTPFHKEGTYKVEKDYDQLLSRLLCLHEKNNVMGHNHGKHKVIKGDCRKTIPQFFKDNANEVVALSFFDLNAIDPTKESFEAIFERTVPGGIVAFWQLSREAIQAEGYVYATEILNKVEHSLRRSKYYPSLCYITKEED